MCVCRIDFILLPPSTCIYFPFLYYHSFYFHILSLLFLQEVKTLEQQHKYYYYFSQFNKDNNEYEEEKKKHISLRLIMIYYLFELRISYSNKIYYFIFIIKFFFSTKFIPVCNINIRRDQFLSF